MLVVKIELHSAVTGKVTTLATGRIINTGTGSPTRGNYVAVFRDAKGREWKSGTVTDFPRKRLLAWDLLYRCLEKLIGQRNITLKTVPTGGLTNREATLRPQGEKR
jgi:hypothetical protein